jgi:hypothetical protein
MHGGTLWVVVYLMSVDAMQCNAMGAVRVPLVLEILEVESSIDSANQVLILPNQVINSANHVLILPIKCLILPI